MISKLAIPLILFYNKPGMKKKFFSFFTLYQGALPFYYFLITQKRLFLREMSVP